MGLWPARQSRERALPSAPPLLLAVAGLPFFIRPHGVARLRLRRPTPGLPPDGHGSKGSGTAVAGARATSSRPSLSSPCGPSRWRRPPSLGAGGGCGRVSPRWSWPGWRCRCWGSQAPQPLHGDVPRPHSAWSSRPTALPGWGAGPGLLAPLRGPGGRAPLVRPLLLPNVAQAGGQGPGAGGGGTPRGARDTPSPRRGPLAAGRDAAGGAGRRDGLRLRLGSPGAAPAPDRDRPRRAARAHLRPTAR